MRYARSSHNEEALAKVDSDCRHLLQGGVTSGRVFWLRGITITNASAANADQVVLWDSASEGKEDTGPDAADRRLLIYCGQANTVSLDFAAPGIKFEDGVLAAALNDPAVGDFPLRSISIQGYEE